MTGGTAVLNNTYESPFNTRYASSEMQYIFSPDKKFTTWRKLWVALAKAEKKLGLSVTQEQIDEMIANVDNINYDVAAERENRSDMMSWRMFMLLASSARVQSRSFISEPHPAMSEIIQMLS